ncbi:hypothetical protein RB601_006511 [Gaeumannomyces tritici]
MGGSQSSLGATDTNRDVGSAQQAGQLMDFDESFLPKVRPPLGPAADFGLSSGQVIKIFGFNPDNFTSIPSRLVIPVLKGRRESDGSRRTRGWVYIVEPQEWVPVVRHGDSVTVSEFASPRSKMRSPCIAESKFNSGCKASIYFQHGGSFYSTRSDVRQTAKLAFEYSDTSATEAQLRRNGVADDTLVQELLLYPILRCKGIKRQRIDYIVNMTRKSLEWAAKPSYTDGLERVRVKASRLARRIANLQLHPVPVYGSEGEDEARLLPVPEIGQDGDMQVMTLLSRADWPDWYIYEAPFEEWTKTIDLAAPQNDVAVRPSSCWTTLLDEFLGEGSDDNDSVSTDGELEVGGESSSGKGPRNSRKGDMGLPRGEGIMVSECPF